MGFRQQSEGLSFVKFSKISCLPCGIYIDCLCCILRLLAREGINAEQLTRDLKSFELKTTFEDVFPAEATSVEEYLQQVHEMEMVSAIQEAQKDKHQATLPHLLASPRSP